MDEVKKLSPIKDDCKFTSAISNVDSATFSTSIRSPPQETATTTTQVGRCESDAIHPRLLNKHQKETIKCKSCGQTFYSISLDEIVDHYENVEHKEFYAICRYCGGQVHQYQYINETRNYHSCSRCRSGKEK